MSSLVEIKEKMDNMWEEEEWALNWLDTEDIYTALNPYVIESVHIKKWMEHLSKSKEKIVD